VLITAALGAQRPTPQSETSATYRSGPSLSSPGRRGSEERQAWVEVLPAHDRDLAVFAATRIHVPGSRLIEWTRQIELLYKSRYVPVIKRFSNPPRLDDLEGLTLDDKDLDDIANCEPGNCGLKLSRDEINHLRETIAQAGVEWKDAVQEAFRRMVLARAQRYLALGDAGMPPYDDKKKPLSPASEFADIIRQSDLSIRDVPALGDYVKHYPRVEDPGVESFLYWSKEKLGAKPIISVTHVSIIGPDEPTELEALIVARQVYASHYMTGALGLTAITSASGGSERYLVYLNRSRADVFDGVFGGWVRRIVERRLRSEAPPAIEALRLRLESGSPPVLEVP
jgi:hypothetical protein